MFTIMGAGAWGTALALSLPERGGHSLTLWTHNPDLAESIRADGENTAFLPGFPLPASIIVTGSSAGLGFETARAMAAKGAEVVMAGRDPAKNEAAAARKRTCPARQSGA